MIQLKFFLCIRFECKYLKYIFQRLPNHALVLKFKYVQNSVKVLHRSFKSPPFCFLKFGRPRYPNLTNCSGVGKKGNYIKKPFNGML